MELQTKEHIDALTEALGSVQNDWPFAKISINLESISARFEGVLRVIFMEQYLRDPGLARKAMHDACFQVFNQFIRHRHLSRSGFRYNVLLTSPRPWRKHPLRRLPVTVWRK